MVFSRSLIKEVPDALTIFVKIRLLARRPGRVPGPAPEAPKAKPKAKGEGKPNA
jgi:hypothetical protein